MKKILMLLAVLSPAFIMSCSDDPAPTTPPTVTVGVNLMPLANGNFWIQNVNNLDTLGATTSTQIDTLTSSATMTYKAKNAAMIINSNGGTKDTSYCASEGSKVYLGASTYEKILNAFSSAYGINIKLNSDWVKVADYDAATWSEPETQLKDVPFTIGAITGTINGTVKINGKKGTNTAAVLNNKSYSANGYDLDIVFEGSANVLFSGTPIPNAAIIKVSTTQKYWFIDGVGLYKSTNGNTDLSLTVTNDLLKNLYPSSSQKYGGREATTTSFKLN